LPYLICDLSKEAQDSLFAAITKCVCEKYTFYGESLAFEVADGQ